MLLLIFMYNPCTLICIGCHTDCHKDALKMACNDGRWPVERPAVQQGVFLVQALQPGLGPGQEHAVALHAAAGAVHQPPGDRGPAALHAQYQGLCSLPSRSLLPLLAVSPRESSVGVRVRASPGVHCMVEDLGALTL